MSTPATPHTPPAVRGAGLGPMPHANGTAFRVWAPNADAVSVFGTFDAWDPAAHPMRREPDGCWYADVPRAKPGDEYRYHITYRGESFGRIDPRARALTDSKGNGLIHDPGFDWEGDDFTPAPIDTLVLYEMHIGTFNAEGGTTGSGCGTFETAIARLGHLKELGVTGVTLMPVTEFVGDCGWGYDMAHLYGVESSYGGPRGLKAFVRAAHRHGIAVFLDVVYNHFGIEDNLLWRFDGWHERDKGGIYFFQDDVRADTPWGPRPDYSRPEVRAYVLDNVRMWLDEYRVDGLRVDGTFHMRTASRTERGEGPHLEEGWSLLRDMTDLVRRAFPRAILTAEDMRGDPLMTRPAEQGGAGFRLQWSDKFAKTARMSLATEDRALAMNAVRDSLLLAYDGDPFRRIIFAESHDNAGKDGRIPAVAAPEDPQGPNAIRRSALAIGTVFTTPGVPQLFQGQELLDPRHFDIKLPHPLDLDRKARFGGVLRFTRDLIALRRNAGGFTAGLTGPHIEIIHADAVTGLLAWRRWKQGGPGDDVLVIANFSDEPRKESSVPAPSPGRWRVRLDSESKAYGPGLGTACCPDPPVVSAGDDGQPCRLGISIGPWGFLILSQETGAG